MFFNGGSKGAHPTHAPPIRPKIFSNSCFFWKFLAKFESDCTLFSSSSFSNSELILVVTPSMMWIDPTCVPVMKLHAWLRGFLIACKVWGNVMFYTCLWFILFKGGGQGSMMSLPLAPLSKDGTPLRMASPLKMAPQPKYSTPKETL